MWEILVVVSAGALPAGCVAFPSAYDGAKPSQTAVNIDSSTTFEFLFPTNDFDEDMARQRIDEYFTRYINEKGFTSYEVVSVSSSDTEVEPNPRKTNTRILVQVRF
jgi:hypothetical protein